MGAKNSCKVKVNWIHSEKINETNVTEKLSGLSGVFGSWVWRSWNGRKNIHNKIFKRI